MTSITETLNDLDPRVRGVMMVQVVVVFAAVLGVAGGWVGFGLAVLAMFGVFLVTGFAYGYLLVFGRN